MGKGDRRSRKGKIWAHSYGVTRKRKPAKGPAFVPKAKKEKPAAKEVVAETEETVVAKAPAKKTAAKKAPAAKKSAKKKAE